MEKQTWLTEEEIFKGKPRFVEVELFNKQNEAQKLCLDREHYWKSTLLDNDPEVNSADAKVEDAYLDTSDQGEVSFLVESPKKSVPVSDFNWPQYTKDLVKSAEAELLFDVMADLNAHALVPIGDVKLEGEDEQNHLKAYRTYVSQKKAIKAIKSEISKKVVKQNVEKSKKVVGKTVNNKKKVKKEQCQKKKVTTVEQKIMTQIFVESLSGLDEEEEPSKVVEENKSHSLVDSLLDNEDLDEKTSPQKSFVDSLLDDEDLKEEPSKVVVVNKEQKKEPLFFEKKSSFFLKRDKKILEIPSKSGGEMFDNLMKNFGTIVEPDKAYHNVQIERIILGLKKGALSSHDKENNSQTPPIMVTKSLDKCPVCSEMVQHGNDHLIEDHYKERILKEYPRKDFRCNFKGCSLYFISLEKHYAHHIGIKHNVLAKYLDEIPMLKNVVVPEKKEFLDDAENVVPANNSKNKLGSSDVAKLPSVPPKKISPEKNRPCPLCTSRFSSNRSILKHLSAQHFASRIKEDFPILKDQGKYICPIVNCSELSNTVPDFVHHINIDHDQLDIYLNEHNVKNIYKGGSKKRGRKKRKLSSSVTNSSSPTNSKKKSKMESN